MYDEMLHICKEGISVDVDGDRLVHSPWLIIGGPLWLRTTRSRIPCGGGTFTDPAAEMACSRLFSSINTPRGESFKYERVGAAARCADFIDSYKSSGQAGIFLLVVQQQLNEQLNERNYIPSGLGSAFLEKPPKALRDSGDHPNAQAVSEGTFCVMLTNTKQFE
uniref:Uncharacterized protein n=1 Tax=Glossina pallidipes TaxID=7398 RepID=A0A1A9ZVF9_GLOPL